MSPKTIGARVAIPIGAVDAKRTLELDGFWPEACSGAVLTMRRDFHSATIAHQILRSRRRRGNNSRCCRWFTGRFLAKRPD